MTTPPTPEKRDPNALHKYWSNVEITPMIEMAIAACGLPSRADIPRPGDVGGWSLRDWAAWAKEKGFAELARTTHSFQYIWPSYPKLRFGLATSPGDTNSYVNAAQDLNKSWRRAVGIAAIIQAAIVEGVVRPTGGITDGYRTRYPSVFVERLMILRHFHDEMRKDLDMLAEIDAMNTPNVALEEAFFSRPEPRKLLNDHTRIWFGIPPIIRVFEAVLDPDAAPTDRAEQESLEEETTKILVKLERDFKVTRAQLAKEIDLQLHEGRLQLSTMVPIGLVRLRNEAQRVYDELDEKREAEKEAKRAARETADKEREDRQARIADLQSRQFRTEEGHWRKTGDRDEAHELIRQHRTLSQRVVAESSAQLAKVAAELAALGKNLEKMDLPIFDGIADGELAAAVAALAVKEQEVEDISLLLDRERNTKAALESKIDELSTDNASLRETITLAEIVDKEAKEHVKKLCGLVKLALSNTGDVREIRIHERQLLAYVDVLEKTFIKLPEQAQQGQA
jgi:hypothetical protein